MYDQDKDKDKDKDQIQIGAKGKIEEEGLKTKRKRVYDHGSLEMQFIDLTHAGQRGQRPNRQKGE